MFIGSNYNRHFVIHPPFVRSSAHLVIPPLFAHRTAGPLQCRQILSFSKASNSVPRPTEVSWRGRRFLI